MSSENYSTITSLDQYNKLVESSKSRQLPILLLFLSSWHSPCQQMVTLVQQLSRDESLRDGAVFALIDAENVSEVTEQFEEVISVPTTILFDPIQKKVIEAIQGTQTEQVTISLKRTVQGNTLRKSAQTETPSTATASAASSSSAAAASTSTKAASTSAAPKEPFVLTDELRTRLTALTNASPVMIFIKGTPETPRCGFTRQLLTLLTERKIRFDSFDILSDQAVREGLKVLSSWPTYPQMYIKGELVGGLDVIKELDANGELKEMIPSGHIEASESSLEDRLRGLINSNRIMLFMKGRPEEPQCGFSSSIVDLLNSYTTKADPPITYGSFDIFTDQEVREGLKKFSQWPTYPQLYVDGELIGGLDVVKELHSNGELKEILEGSAK